MTNNKPFKTFRQQMKILRNRGLTVESNDKRALEEHGYYSIINGYKQLFLQKDSTGKPVEPEKYIPNATFKEIKSLYDFDRELRQILYTPLMEYESNLGSEISYRFSEKYPEEHSYLAMDNFSRNSSDVVSVVQTISNLSNKIKQNAKENNAIKHYINKHGHVPLWVLVNFLTFGDLNYLYQNCEEDIKATIAKDFMTKHKRYYNLPSYPIHVKSIESINTLVNFFRNSVAHGEITYRKTINRGITFSYIKQDLSINQYPLPNSSQCGVFELVASLKLVLNKKQYTTLKKNIQSLFSKYQDKFHSVSFTAILNDMHFPENYNNIL
ncbi:Abi family protein [Lactobacillus sp. ESL0679]|uniref:Abi family protein n=1 Tax=Lactobacillus sp. ESL0679 TaxID=2983209 RepID=UPI0023F7C5BE|nr:Abi family protein [Lactobacillus sp. ESL0679]MDF7683481.1 Abi family protein [Lactobacillus sp. ESL0679]